MTFPGGLLEFIYRLDLAKLLHKRDDSRSGVPSNVIECEAPQSQRVAGLVSPAFCRGRSRSMIMRGYGMAACQTVSLHILMVKLVAYRVQSAVRCGKT